LSLCLAVFATSVSKSGHTSTRCRIITAPIETATDHYTIRHTASLFDRGLLSLTVITEREINAARRRRIVTCNLCQPFIHLDHSHTMQNALVCSVRGKQPTCAKVQLFKYDCCCCRLLGDDRSVGYRELRPSEGPVLNQPVRTWLVWRSGNGVRHINEVKLRRARLVLGLVTIPVFIQATQAQSAWPSLPYRWVQ